MKRDKGKTKEQLINELEDVRQLVVKLEASEAKSKQTAEALRVREEQLSILFDSVNDVIFKISVEPNDCYRFTMVNSRFLEVTGLSKAQIVGKLIQEVIPKPAHALVLGKYREAIHTGQPTRWKEVSVYPAGKKTGEVTVTPVFDADGNCTQLVGTVHDMTERMRTVEALVHSEERFRAIFDSTADGLLLAGTESKNFLDGNKAICRMLGYTLEEIKNMGIMDIHPEEELASVLEKFEKLPEGDTALLLDIPVKRKDGSVFYADINSALITFAGKTFQVGVFQDVTEHRKAEKTLQESETLYRSLFDNMLNGFAYCEMLFEQGKPSDFVYLSVNRAFEALTGLKNVVGKKVSEVIPGIQKSDPELFEIYGRVALTGIPERFETYLQSLEMWFSISVYSPEKEHFVAVFDVITERRKAEEQLRIAERNFRNSLDDSPLGIRIVTEDGELLYANMSILDVYGYSRIEEFETTPAKERYTPVSFAEHQKRRELRKQGKPVPSNYEISIVRKDGEIRHLSVSRKEVTWNGKIQFQSIYQDITERKRADIKLEQLAKEWQTTFNSITDRISIHDKDLRVVRVNKAYADTFKMSPEAPIGKHCY